MRSALATLLLPCVVGKRRGTRPQVALRWLVHAFICTGLGGAINTALAQVSALGPPASMVAANAITNFTASAGNNRLLVVTVSHADNGTTQAYPSVAFGAQPLTQTVISSDGQSAMDSIWVLPLGTSASATVATITATPNAGALTRPTAFL